MIMAAAVQAIGRNKMRSALTMLGVFIGVAALIAMVAVGQGANEAVRKQIESLGTNLVVVLPGARDGGRHARAAPAAPPRSRSATRRRSGARARPSARSAISSASPARCSTAIRTGRRSIQGVSPNYPPMTNWRIAAGREISPDDEATAALVVVIGQTVSTAAVRRVAEPDRRAHPGQGRAAAGDRRARGQGANVVRPGSGRPGHDPVHHRRAQGARRRRAERRRRRSSTGSIRVRPTPTACTPHLAGYVNQIYVQAVNSADVQPAIGQVTEMLARRHRIKPGDDNDFSVRNLSQIAESRREPAAASWRCCSPPSPRSRWWSAASAS